MQSVNQHFVPNLAAVSEGYAQWRESGVSRRYTPEHLQQQTVALLQHYPKGVICKTLKISYSALKQWTLGTPPTDAATVVKSGSAVTVSQNAGFIPLPATPTLCSQPASGLDNPTQETVLRITLPNGTALSATVPLSTLLMLINQPGNTMEARSEYTA